jgi:uracil-DNA glycosylase family 4
MKELGNPLCTLCPLHETAKTICVMGNGSITSRIMIIGEAPGANEDEQGEPFVGTAGKILNEALAKAGLPREEVYVTNVVKCRPPKNRRPTVDEIRACSKYLIREYKTINPTHVLLLGNTALHTITNRRSGISMNRGHISPHDSSMVDCVTFATYHPAATVYSRETHDHFEQDIKHFGEKVRSGHSQQKVNEG